MIRRLAAGLNRRAAAGLVLLFAALLLAPALLDRYTLSVLILILYFAYLGQAWNVMMGFAGLLSLGHALYIGLGAYSAAALFVHFGIPPLLGLFPGIALAALAGAVIGWLGFRFRIAGVYFALLTIAFAEFTRIGFDHIAWTGASGGLFLPVAAAKQQGLLYLRGGPAMYYYVMLALTAAGFVLCAALLRSRLGFYWLAIREDEDAARALGIDVFRCRMAAVMLSAAMTAVAGVFNAFYNNNLFPEHIFGIGSSIDLLLGPVIGGLGTLMGPIIGAFILTPIGEFLLGTTRALGIEYPGIELVFRGLLLIVIIRALPSGVWPWLAQRLGFTAPLAKDRT
ncbi:MAG TPA: branched-chain amino acid ABC transporter permease [Alphaproteobacteria bacterium]|nr:branched-chain amino acid ABC transporter permease [Alphaproteobacteria bacterium]